MAEVRGYSARWRKSYSEMRFCVLFLVLLFLTENVLVCKVLLVTKVITFQHVLGCFLKWQWPEALVQLQFLDRTSEHLTFHLWIQRSQIFHFTFYEISSGSLSWFSGWWTQLSFPETACFYIFVGSIFWVMQMLWQCTPFVIRALTHSLE